MGTQDRPGSEPLMEVERRVLTEVSDKIIPCSLIVAALSLEGYSARAVNRAVRSLEGRGMLACALGGAYSLTDLGRAAMAEMQ